MPWNQIDSVKNPKVKNVKRLMKRKFREREQQFVIEGWHLLKEAEAHDVKITDVFIEETKDIPEDVDVSDLPVSLVTGQVMQEMSRTETPQGVAAICRMPEETVLDVHTGHTYLFIDGVQDPGNLGTMIRTADAAGVTAVILGEGTVDGYNDKVVRATQGSLFHLPVLKGELGEWIQACRTHKIPIFGTSVNEGTSHTAIGAQKGFALLVGNEGSGVQHSLLDETDQNIYVPIYGNAESLNVSVAAGILLYHLKQPY
ncbi:TrmH family RNA methyltransferase [Salibacterium qingdaonense]|uniref:RNA methyltransferase, TrmH family n=1 Tax=Salibacterium qingdaonense TaxID=266892 RepID=A0A1I4PUP5_9BACI|nr:RNA methyltransferase [Salibacterium qingdaonense]SFM31551.1 RNA methyltransferase, TrmH family [Salibacterium qingdaonense]